MQKHRPERETRRRIEQELAAKRTLEKVSAEVLLAELGLRTREIEAVVRRNSRKRPPGMAPALVEPPRGPRPLQGGAAAPLEFD